MHGNSVLLSDCCYLLNLAWCKSTSPGHLVRFVLFKQKSSTRLARGILILNLIQKDIHFCQVLKIDFYVITPKIKFFLWDLWKNCQTSYLFILLVTLSNSQLNPCSSNASLKTLYPSDVCLWKSTIYSQWNVIIFHSRRTVYSQCFHNIFADTTKSNYS